MYSSKNSADVIIIGAGVIGTSLAFHLARQGCRDVVVLEKDGIGSGATEKCAGGIRQQFSVAANIRLSMESVRFFADFENETGCVPDFRQNGYLILATTPAEMAEFQGNVALQQRLGLAVDLLSPQEVVKILPGLRVDDIRGASFCRTDGYADPYSVVHGFASAAKRQGVRIIQNTAVTGIDLRQDRVQGVVTPAGRYAAPIVINAAGAYAALVGKMAGLDIPVRPTRRHIFVTEPVFRREKDFLPGDHWLQPPMVVDFHNGFWFRREGPGLILGMRNPDEPPGFATSVDWDFFTSAVAPSGCRRLPALADIGIMRAQAGLHPDTPDDMAILGRAPGIEGLYLACGMCGHGFMHAPAVGRLMAALVLGKIKELPDAALFDLTRFQSGQSTKEKAII